MLSTSFSSSRCFSISRSRPLLRFRNRSCVVSRLAGGFYARSMSTSTSLPDVPFFRAIHRHDPRSSAVVHSDGKHFTYGSLVADVSKFCDQLREEQLKTGSSESGAEDGLTGRRVTFLAPNTYDYIGNSSTCTHRCQKIVRLIALNL